MSAKRCMLRRARPLLGTLVEIAAAGPTESAVGAAIAQAFDAVEAVQRAMSYHDPASDVSRLNQAGTDTVTVDPQTWQVLDTALSVSAASDGAFDVSVAPELVRQGYLPAHDAWPRPSDDACWRDLELLADNRVRLARPLHIDLGGIAKGYAVDRARHVLLAAGVSSGRINAGGDLVVFGRHPATIHVRHPLQATTSLPLCALRAGAVATSARYFNVATNPAASPLIDARTRRPCGGRHSVSVVADDCIVADALTKVVFADPGAALSVLRQFGAYAVIVDAHPDTADVSIRRSDAEGWHELKPASLDEATS